MSDQGQTLAAFVERELAAERERRPTLDARATTVITTSAGLTTVLAAVGAFITGQTGLERPTHVIWPVTMTLLAFSAAALCAIMTAGLRWYDITDSATLNEMLTTRWRSDEVDARNYVALQNIKTIESLRGGNDTKAWWLKKAHQLQVVALISLTLAVFLIMRA